MVRGRGGKGEDHAGAGMGGSLVFNEADNGGRLAHHSCLFLDTVSSTTPF